MANKPLLKYGSTGNDVKELQSNLNNRGYNLAVDGVFGKNTLNAVQDFQVQNKLQVDGIVGGNTWGSLAQPTQSTTTATKPQTTPTQPKSYSNVDLSQYNNGFQASDAYNSAVNKKTEAENAVSNYGDFEYSQKDLYDAVIDKIFNREKFSYDLNGDALYQQYKDKYIQQGKMAMQDTMGQAAAMTGGYGNSYAATVGNQAYQAQLQNLNDVIPELYQLAYDKYNQEGQDLYNQYAMLSDEKNTEDAQWGDKYNRLMNERDYASNEANNLYNKEYGEYTDSYNRDYNQYWNETNLGYQKDRDAVSDQQWQAQFDEAKRQYDEQQAFQQEQYDEQSALTREQWEWQKAQAEKAASSGGSSSGSSSSGNKTTSQAEPELKISNDIKETASSFTTNSALENYLDGLVSDGTLTETEADALYEENMKGVADFKDRTWTVTDDGGWNWWGGVDGDVKVKDQYGNEYTLEDLIDELVNQGMSKKDAKAYVKKYQ